MVRKKHVPQRTCVVCQKVIPKRDLIRIVRTPDQRLLVDERGKAPGRGAYLCRKASCWQESSLSRNLIGRALKMSISDEDWAFLKDTLASLPRSV